MNEKFFSLSTEKQNQIINAGYRVFALNSYKKSPMSEIAAEAGISKSLLFHYFKNKKELYLFLWEQAVKIGMERMVYTQTHKADDFFEMMQLGLKAKIEMMRVYPYISMFTIRAFYEKDEEVSGEILDSYKMVSHNAAGDVLSLVNPSCFRPGIDLKMMCQQMYWASEGYLWEMMQRGIVDVDVLERDAEEMLKFWRDVYGNPKQRKT